MISLLSVFSFARQHAKTIAILLLVLAAVGFTSAWHVRGQRITALEAERTALVAELQTRDQQLAQAREAAARLGARLREREDARSGIGRVMEGVARAAPDQDGTVAPVLRDALDGLGRLRQRPVDQGQRP